MATTDSTPWSYQGHPLLGNLLRGHPLRTPRFVLPTVQLFSDSFAPTHAKEFVRRTLEEATARIATTLAADDNEGVKDA